MACQHLIIVWYPCHWFGVDLGRDSPMLELCQLSQLSLQVILSISYYAFTQNCDSKLSESQPCGKKGSWNKISGKLPQIQALDFLKIYALESPLINYLYISFPMTMTHHLVFAFIGNWCHRLTTSGFSSSIFATAKTMESNFLNPSPRKWKMTKLSCKISWFSLISESSSFKMWLCENAGFQL